MRVRVRGQKKTQREHRVGLAQSDITAAGRESVRFHGWLSYAPQPESE